MNLKQLQTNLFSLIKSGSTELAHDDYMYKIQTSKNLMLIRKIAVWWRRIQIEQYCLLTSNFLKMQCMFDAALGNFFIEQKYSSFREQVGLQFLKFIIAKKPASLACSIAEFELAIIKVKLGEDIESSIHWAYEPYCVINGLLNNCLVVENLESGEYNIEVSSKNKKDLFLVKMVKDIFEGS